MTRISYLITEIKVRSSLFGWKHAHIYEETVTSPHFSSAGERIRMRTNMHKHAAYVNQTSEGGL